MPQKPFTCLPVSLGLLQVFYGQRTFYGSSRARRYLILLIFNIFKTLQVFLDWKIFYMCSRPLWPLMDLLGPLNIWQTFLTQRIFYMSSMSRKKLGSEDPLQVFHGKRTFAGSNDLLAVFYGKIVFSVLSGSFQGFYVFKALMQFMIPLGLLIDLLWSEDFSHIFYN